MPPRLDEERAQFVLAKIDHILEWERETDKERDTKFVDLGRYLCEVRAGQYWRLQNLKSFDEYLARKFPESRRKAYYLMSIHEQLPRSVKEGTPACRLVEGSRTCESGEAGRGALRLCKLVAQGPAVADAAVQG